MVEDGAHSDCRRVRAGETMYAPKQSADFSQRRWAAIRFVHGDVRLKLNLASPEIHSFSLVFRDLKQMMEQIGSAGLGLLTSIRTQPLGHATARRRCDVINGFQTFASRRAEQGRPEDDIADDWRRHASSNQHRQQSVARGDVAFMIMRILHESELLSEEELADDVERIPVDIAMSFFFSNRGLDNSERTYH
jgi:hypothetical protein